MVEARDIIAKEVAASVFGSARAMPSDYVHASNILSALTAAGYRVVREGGVDAAMIEAGAAGMYGSKWNDPRDDHRPGEAMKDVWRKYARDCLTAALRALAEAKP